MKSEIDPDHGRPGTRVNNPVSPGPAKIDVEAAAAVLAVVAAGVGSVVVGVEFAAAGAEPRSAAAADSAFETRLV